MLANTITTSRTPIILNTDPLGTIVCAPTICEDASGLGGTIENTNLLPWVKPCDSCGAAVASVYCHADAAYLCTTCDEQVHVANHVASRHERVPMCEVCEQAPAVLTCSADTAALCTVCDASVHSANKLARRHQRIPILPLPSFFPENKNNGTTNVMKEKNEQENDILYGGEINEYLHLADLDSCYNDLGNENQEGNMMSSNVMAAATTLTGEEFTASYSYMGSMTTMSQSVSSLEASVAPDTTITDISNSHLLASNGLDIISTSTLQMHVDFSAVDREARVMRYKEKKRMRKFEKTIRYASRKAYAEVKPRIKGRFAKRSEVELEVDEMFSPSDLADQNYGIMSWH